MSGDVGQVDALDGYAEDEERERYDTTDAEGRTRICERKCDTCIIGGSDPSQRKALRPGRLAQMINDARAGGGSIVCHSTFGDGTAALCRGFEDTFGSNYARIMHRIGGLVEVDPHPHKRKGDDSAEHRVQDQIRGHT